MVMPFPARRHKWRGLGAAASAEFPNIQITSDRNCVIAPCTAKRAPKAENKKAALADGFQFCPADKGISGNRIR
jgi:hypothetical protein